MPFVETADRAVSRDPRPRARPASAGRPGPRIAIDVRMVRDSGIGTYIRNVVPRLAATRPDWRLVLLGPRDALAELGWDRFANVEMRDCRARIYSLSEQLELARALHGGIDLLWSPHYNVPLLWRGPLAVTVHDVFHLAMPGQGVARRAYARTLFHAVRRRARVVLCDSAFTRDEYARLVGVGRAVPEVVPLGVSADWWVDRAAFVPPRARPYVVYVGNVKPHKNLGRLVQAMGALRDAVPHDLVIVGRREGMRTVDEDVARDAAALGDRVHFTGAVTDADLRRWVACADALAMPSLYEGFGLPPLEAMAAGCPTVVSRAASLPEVCGDAAHYCDPLDVGSLSAALRDVLTDAVLRERLRARGHAQAARFTWDACAARTAEVLARACDVTADGSAS